MQQQVIVSLFGGLPPLCIPFSTDTLVTVEDLKTIIFARTLIPVCDQRLTTTGGLQLYDTAPLFQDDEPFMTLSLKLPLLGGKGGFGSMLRAQGGKMASQKTTNFEACRDLNGRRLRTINEAKKLADYLEKEPERQRMKEEKIKKKIEEGMCEPPTKKHRFNDTQFLEESQEIIEDVKKAVSHAMKVKKQNSKKSAKKNVPMTSLSMWNVEMSDYESSGSSAEESDNDSNKSSTQPDGDDDDVKMLEVGTSAAASNAPAENDKSTDDEQESGYSTNTSSSKKKRKPVPFFDPKGKGNAVASRKRKSRDEDDEDE